LDEGGVLLTAKLDNKYVIRKNEAVVIRSGSLIGDAVLEFVPGRLTGASTEPIEDGEFIANTAVANDPIQVLVNLESKVSSAIDRVEAASYSIEDAGQRIGVLAENLNTVVSNNGDQFLRIIQKTEVAMDHFHSAMKTVDEVVGDPEMKVNLKRALKELPSLFDDARGTLSDARKTLNGFQQMSARADANLQNLEKFTRPLAERGDILVGKIENSVTSIEELLEQLVGFSSKLNSGEGSLGKLMNDRELYDKLRRSADNVEDATRKLKPILDDVRIFTDKIATDPRQLGIKGALDRRPSGVGLKHGILTTDE
jgi:phospholipid/cholesterol/gamma-HCH transport system substrate-binding protein